MKKDLAQQKADLEQQRQALRDEQLLAAEREKARLHTGTGRQGKRAK